MHLVWAGGAVTTRDVHEQLLQYRDVALTTVTGLMGNLAHRGLLERRLKGRAYLYVLSREGMRALVEETLGP